MDRGENRKRRKPGNRLSKVLQIQAAKVDKPLLKVNSISSLDEDGLVKAIIETPKNSRNKYKFDPQCGIYECESPLQAGLCFPFDFGFIPSTIAEDGDPLDVIVLMDEPSFPGCFVHVRIIGVIEAEQTEDGVTVRNDRLVGVHAKSILFGEYVSWKELPHRLRNEMEMFFTLNNKTKGREFVPLGWRGTNKAYELMSKAVLAQEKKTA